MPHRFYYPGPFPPGTLQLAGPEAHHLSHVLRLRPGEEVELFDGAGGSALARVLAIGRHAVDLQILRVLAAAPPAPAIVIATAVPKGERFRGLVEKCTELGVARLIPLKTERSIVDPRETKLHKLMQSVVAACKQCGRNHLLEIAPVTPWDELVRREFSEHDSLLADPSGVPAVEALNRTSGVRPLLACIGPEGGFSPSEIDQAVAHGATLVHLGPFRLRVETAAITCAALLTAHRAAARSS